MTQRHGYIWNGNKKEVICDRSDGNTALSDLNVISSNLLSVSQNVACIANETNHSDQKSRISHCAGSTVVKRAATKLNDRSSSYMGSHVTYTVQVVIYRGFSWCKTETRWLQTANKNWYMSYGIASFLISFNVFSMLLPESSPSHASTIEGWVRSGDASFTGWMPMTGFGSECVSRCTSVYTTWRLDTCRHSANPCPAFLVVVTYARLVMVNWTFHVLIWLRTGDGRLPMPVPHLGTFYLPH